jgi:hypothetical protein
LASERSPWHSADRYLVNLPIRSAELARERFDRDAESFSEILARLDEETQALRLKMDRSRQPRGGFPAIFIYYARESERNPYAKRPYMTKHRMLEPASFVFDRFPERFERAYALPEDEVVIWKLIQ